MRKMYGSMGARTRTHPRGVEGYAAPILSKAGSAGLLILLSILFWSIFYQNLPNNLDGFASKGPIVTENIADRIIKVVMILVSVYAIVARWSTARLLAKNFNLGAAAFLVLAPLSAAWSIEPADTLLRCVSLASIVLICFAICVTGWHRQRLQQLSIPPLMLILVASLVVGIIMPDRITEIGTDLSQKDAWHGITHGKNEFGMIASLGVIFCANKWLSREALPIWPLAGTVTAFTCLVLSRSNTSMIATLVGVFSMVLVMRVAVIRQRFTNHVVIGFAATILLYESVIQNLLPGVNTLLAPIMRLTGKDTTFSARTIIWGVLKEHIQGAPYLGTGYGAYWTGPFPTSPSYVFVPLMYFYPTEGHNGYLDVVNDLGMVGLCCVLAFLLCYIRQALQLMRFDRNQAALYLALLFQEMVMNMSESDWFSRTSTFTVIILAIVCLSRAVLDGRLHARPIPVQTL
jgi:exopolysaccharide production protein ExoQ